MTGASQSCDGGIIYRGDYIRGVAFPCTERDDCKQKIEELAAQLQELSEKNRALAVENEEIPLLRDSVEEMKYLESKVVSDMNHGKSYGRERVLGFLNPFSQEPKSQKKNC
jgi:hypothetical protein